MSGLNPEPCASYSLVDRFLCGKCGKQPEVVSAAPGDPIMVTVMCHGEKFQKAYTKKELVFTQVLFKEDED